MNSPLFTGICTAMVTPFLNEKVNYPMLDILLQRQMDAGVQAVVLCGTTGEAATLTDAEKLEIIRRSKTYCGDRLRIIAGTGTNSTSHTAMLSKAAEDAGADALLIVTPYYNKPTPEGIYGHYLTVCHSTQLPIIVYNVPARTGLDIPVSLYQRLSRLPRIIGVKEASADIRKIASIRAACPKPFGIWTGCDDMIVPSIALGADGVISVVSNIIPDKAAEMTNAAILGDYRTAASIQLELLPLTDSLFRETNPVPVKAGMCLLGYDCGSCRLPLTPAKEETVNELKHALLPI